MNVYWSSVLLINHWSLLLFSSAILLQSWRCLLSTEAQFLSLSSQMSPIPNNFLLSFAFFHFNFFCNMHSICPLFGIAPSAECVNCHYLRTLEFQLRFCFSIAETCYNLAIRRFKWSFLWSVIIEESNVVEQFDLKLLC